MNRTRSTTHPIESVGKEESVKSVKNSRWSWIVLAAMTVVAVMLFVGCSSNSVADDHDPDFNFADDAEHEGDPAKAPVAADPVELPSGNQVSGKPGQK
jgi:hypothetical protein